MALAEVLMETAGDSKGIVGPALTVAAVGTSVFKAITIIGPNERGLRTKFGIPIQDSEGNYKVSEPGPRMTYPFTHSIIKIDVANRATKLEPIVYDREEQRIAHPTVHWGIKPDGESLFRSQFNVEDGELGQAARGIFEGGIFEALLSTSEEVFTRPDCRLIVEQQMQLACGEALDELCGGEIRRLDIHLAKSLGEMVSRNPEAVPIPVLLEQPGVEPTQA